MEECELLHIESLFLVVRKWGFISQTEVDMPTVKQSIGIATAIVMAFVAATAFGISALEQSPPQVATNRFTASKARLGLNDHQRLRTLLGIERAPR
jgi:hypothetical protein